MDANAEANTNANLPIASDKVFFFFQPESVDIFSYFSMKTYVKGTHQKHLTKALLMINNNVCFHGEMKKTYTCHSVLSGAVNASVASSVKTLPVHSYM